MTAPKRYNRILFTAAGALLLAAFGISLLIGAYPLTAQDILSALSGGEGMAVKVFWRLRLPRSLAAMVSGMALGVCGAVYQILFANPLAAPDIMGVSGGATLGAAMAIVWGNTAFSAPAAFLGGMAALAGSLLLTGNGRDGAFRSADQCADEDGRDAAQDVCRYGGRACRH